MLTPESEATKMAAGAAASAFGVMIPPGIMVPSVRSSVPDGWLLCDGRAVSRSTYAALFAAIGTSCGGGDGSTTFNLPDCRDRSVLGASGTKAACSAGGSNSYTPGGSVPATGSASVTNLSLIGVLGNAAAAPGHTHTFTGTPATITPPYFAASWLIKT